jgi:hypothetical protein
MSHLDCKMERLEIFVLIESIYKAYLRPRARILGLMDHVAFPLPCDMKHNYNDSS